MSTTIIIGASAAGLAAANKLRDLNPDEKIVCLTQESTMPYNRCLLADFLSGARTQEQVHTRTEQFFSEKNIELMRNAQVVGLDATAQTITLRGGTTLSYDTLVIATGRSVFIPPPFDCAMPGVFPFYDLDHAQDLLAYMSQTQAKRVLIVGAGITGLECTDALLQRGMQITVIERGSNILARQIDAQGAQFIQELMASKGITTLCSTTAPQVEQRDNHILVSLDNGTQIEVDIVVTATGGRQNTEFARAAGIACDTYGIIVDENQATNVTNIFAAGDVCSIINQASGARTWSTLWPDAVAQGITAANSIAGLCKPFGGTLNITSTHIFGTQLVTCGDFSTKLELDSLTKREAQFYHRFYLEDGVLKGFVMVGNVANVGQLRKAMVEKTRI